MAPLFESSRANELLLIHNACFLSCFRAGNEYIKQLCHECLIKVPLSILEDQIAGTAIVAHKSQ